MCTTVGEIEDCMCFLPTGFANHIFCYLYKWKPWGNCAVALVRLSSRVESNVQDSSCTLSYQQWLHDEYARGCSARCSSTNQPSPSHSEESCSRLVLADPAPSTGCSPSSTARLHSSAAEWSVLCSALCLQASCPECRASPAYIVYCRYHNNSNTQFLHKM